MRRRTVTAVIPFYGDPAPTLALIKSLLAQGDDRLVQVVVSDDCSPAPFPETDGVTIVRRSTNGGFAHAVNSGVAAAAAEDVLILNSDLELAPGFLTTLLDGAAPWMPAVVSCGMTSPDGDFSSPGRHFPTVTHQVVEWLLPLVRLRRTQLLHELVGHDTAVDGTIDQVTDWVVGALMLIPTDAYRSVGEMDETFYMNCEEVDLQRRLAQIGLPRVVLEGVTVMHEGGGSSESERRVAWVMDGRRRYTRKWGGRTGLLRLEVSMIAATAVNLVWNAARRAAGSDVEPFAVARHQLDLVTRPEQWVAEQNRKPPS